MTPIKSSYIYFTKKRRLISANLWYEEIPSTEIKNIKRKWYSTRIIAGIDLKNIGYNISDEDCYNFFDISQNEVGKQITRDIVIHNKNFDDILFDVTITED